MKAVWNEVAEELVDLLKARKVNQDSCVGVILTLRTEEKYRELIQWIHAHPRARQYQILGRLDVFKKPKTAVSYPTQPRVIRKIKVAMF